MDNNSQNVVIILTTLVSRSQSQAEEIAPSPERQPVAPVALPKDESTASLHSVDSVPVSSAHEFTEGEPSEDLPESLASRTDKDGVETN